ncbi:MAG: divergent polysaccharide deacetylase family protein, partial [Spirochaetota bacterium]
LPGAREPVPRPPAGRKPLPAPPPPGPRAKIALIIDDVGYSREDIERFTRLGFPLTFSVLPFTGYSGEQAGLLHDLGYELMLHIPMEPESYPLDDPGPHALFVGDTREVVERKLSLMLRQLPQVQGANNHMGSLATADCRLMSWTMAFLLERDLYFVDSKTTSGSCALSEARLRQLPAGSRDVFLDNRDDYQYITRQFEELKAKALARGTAIGIGHAHSRNLPLVLEQQLPRLEREGIILVYASEAVR